MQIIHKIPVKQILTERSRSELKRRFDQKCDQLERECKQLQFEQKRLERKSGLSRSDIEKRFSREISRRKDRIHWMNHQLNQLEILPNGSELETDEVEALVTISEGDQWQEIHQTEIVIKDGIVIRAR